MAHPMRTGTQDDFGAIAELVLTTFHDDPGDSAILDKLRLVFEPGRSLLATDRGDLVGHVGSYGRALTVPGGSGVPCAFVTNVGVAGDFRRRGIASMLLRQQLTDLAEPLAVLQATEGRIYHRYGYGLASRRVNFKIDTREVRIAAPAGDPGSVRLGRPAELLKDVTEVYDRELAGRPGFADRSRSWWDFLLFDVPSSRRGGGHLQALVHTGPDGADGYALFRVRKGWEIAGPKGEVTVRHVVASSPAAYAALWRYLLQVDLTRSVYVQYAGTDEPLFDLVDEPRRLGARVTDGLWLRIVDVPAGLAARAYQTDDDLVLRVTDDLLPGNNGCFHRDGSPTTLAADISLDAATLAALYLGGGSPHALAAAGRIVEHRRGALAAASAMFGWYRAPVSIETF